MSLHTQPGQCGPSSSTAVPSSASGGKEEQGALHMYKNVDKDEDEDKGSKGLSAAKDEDEDESESDVDISDDEEEMVDEEEEEEDDDDEIRDAEIPTLIEPNGYGSSTCGYCSPVGERSKARTSRSYGFSTPQMSPRVYQMLIDRGWRRSGTYVYHPDMQNTCCPQYTIRLDARAFSPEKDKKMRYIMNRWKKFVMVEDGQKKDDGKVGVKPRSGKGKANQHFDFLEEIHAPEFAQAGSTAKHRFEVKLVPAKATLESFKLYDRYQVAVHGDKSGKNTIGSFSRFLCKNPLGKQRIPYPRATSRPDLPVHYGCYHQQWRIDDKLIAFSVIDILPGCVSSVYFVWDPDYAWASLGKLSALREAALARECAEAGMEGMGWLYMGFYIHSCQKMRYKGGYSPSYLLDPGTNVFHPLDKVKSILEKHPKGYFPFDTTVSSTMAPVDAPSIKLESLAKWPNPPPPSFLDPNHIEKKQVRALLVLLNGQLVRFRDVPFRNPAAVEEILQQLLAALGLNMFATFNTIQRNVFVTF